MHDPEIKVSSLFTEMSSDLLDKSIIKIKNCFDQLSDEEIWWRPEPTVNSVGNLCLHIAGNLKQWGVIPFRDMEDLRQREKEFAADTREERQQLLANLESVTESAKECWNGVSPEKLAEQTVVQGFPVTYLKAILHTSSHFVGHTHQIITLTRLQLGKNYQFQWTPESDRNDLPI